MTEQDTASDAPSGTFRVYDLPFGIEIRVYPEGGATVVSDLADELGKSARAQGAADAVEALLLAMAGQGIDISTEPMSAAVRDAVEALANNIT